MASLDRIASVTISLSTTSVSEESFSDLLIVAPFTGLLARYLLITTADDLTDYGVETTDALYLAAAQAFAQSPSISQVYIGRKQVDSISVTVTTAAAGTYSLTVGYLDDSGDEVSGAVSYTATADDTLATIATGLAAAVGDLPVTITAEDGVVTVAPTTSGDAFSVAVASGSMTAADGTSSETYGEALAAVLEQTTGWYGVAIVSRDQDDILSAAAWCESNTKLFGFAVAESGAITSTSTDNTLTAVYDKGYARTFGYYHALAASEWPEVAIMANRFTYYPGAENWANVKLSSVTVDSLTEAKSKVVKGRYGNSYEKFRNTSITQYGYVAAGEWIDVIRFRDWLVDQLKVEIVSLLVKASAGTGKIPYTSAGLLMVKAAIKGVLDLGVTRGGIAPAETDDDDNVVASYTITMPSISDISATTKATRALSDVSFTARLAGAINNITLTGVLSYED